MISEYVEIANRRIALAKGEDEEVVEAISFFFSDSTTEQRNAITAGLEKCGLAVVQNALGGHQK